MESKKSKTWTAADREALKALLITRTALTDIATALGRPDWAIRERIKPEGWKLPGRRKDEVKSAPTVNTPIIKTMTQSQRTSTKRGSLGRTRSHGYPMRTRPCAAV